MSAGTITVFIGAYLTSLRLAEAGLYPAVCASWQNPFLFRSILSSNLTLAGATDISGGR